MEEITYKMLLPISYLKEKLDISNLKNFILLVSKDNRFYMTFDSPRVKKEKRDWYSLSLNPFEENAYKLVPTEPITELGDNYTYPIYTKYAYYDNNIGKRDPIEDKISIFTELYFGVDGEQISASDIAKLHGKSKTAILHIKNYIMYCLSSILSDYISVFDDNEYSLEYLKYYYNNWVQIVALLNDHVAINNKAMYPIILFLTKNNLIDFKSFSDKFDYYTNELDADPVEELSRELLLDIYNNINNNHYKNTKDRFMGFLVEIKYALSNVGILDLLRFFH